MYLTKDEFVLKIFYHHYTPFFADVFKLIFLTVPFYFILFLLKDTLSFKAVFIFHLVLLFLFVSVLIYLTLIYWLDRLIITNKRIIFIDWKYLTVKVVTEVEYLDIIDIEVINNGIFSKFSFLNFGKINFLTSTSKVAISFPQAPDPIKMRNYIQSLTDLTKNSK
jgi:hypothetical protein